MTGTLHLAAWKLNHRTGKKAIPPAVIHAIAALDIDVLVLTEFVDGDHQVRFKDSLKDIGFESLAVSVKAPRQNQVLIAARTAMADDGLLPLPGHTEAATTNWLHRRLPGLKLEVVGFRAPMYLAADDRTGYWNQVEGIARTARDRRVIFLGDFNCDPFTDTRPCTQVFPRLRGRRLSPAGPEGRLELSLRQRPRRLADRPRAREPDPLGQRGSLHLQGRPPPARRPGQRHHPALRPRAALDPDHPSGRLVGLWLTWTVRLFAAERA